MMHATRWIRATGCCLLSLGLAGAHTAFAQESISEAAKRELSKASSSVDQARRQGALWTTAELALQNAQKAAKSADSAAVIKYAREAEELSRLGMKQASYPLQR